MPENARSTVTVLPLSPLRVAVTVLLPAASAIGLPVRLRVTVGSASLSVIVYVWAVVPPRLALLGFERATMMVSSSSSRASLTTVTAMFCDVTPAVKVSVPEARV